MRYCLRLAYDGTRYHGWQSQHNAHTVQHEIENALEAKLGEVVSLVGCGRTDTGVHAREYYAHFDTEKDIGNDLIFKLNKILPSDIAVYEVLKADENFSARFSATEREYCYYISRIKNPFYIQSAWYRYGPLDWQKMNEAAEMLLGEHDFQAFSKGRTQVNHYRCEIRRAIWEQTDEHLLQFTIVADRFLRNMVRAIVGTLTDVGTGKMSINEFAEVIESRRRSNAGTSVPAHGLYLQRISYPHHLLQSLQKI